MRQLYFGFMFMLLLATLPTLHAVTLETVISREHPQFNCSRAILSIGRDGKVYISSNGGFAIRIDRDGANQNGAPGWGDGFRFITANNAGIIASACAHFAHAVWIYSPQFQKIGGCTDFLVNDALGFDAPVWVAAGENDFYGADPNRDRVMRISPMGKTVGIYVLPRSPEGDPGEIQSLRVHEASGTFFIGTRNSTLRSLGFDGKERWRFANVSQSLFDVANNGHLSYLVGGNQSTRLDTLDAMGKSLGIVNLQVPVDRRPTQKAPYSSFSIWNDELYLKRSSETELFQVYSLADGQFLRAIDIRHEQMKVDFASEIFPTGATLPLTISLKAGKEVVTRKWTVAIAPYGTNWWRNVAWDGNAVTLPSDAEGLYSLRITGPAPEYILRDVVTLRRTNAKGTLTVYTPSGRLGYARGEDIKATVSLRAAGLELANEKATLALITDDGQTIWSNPLQVEEGQPVQVMLPGALTAKLLPGRYRLRATAGEFSSASQPIYLGRGRIGDPPFFFILFGDYTESVMSNTQDAWGSVTPVGEMLIQRTAQMGFNLSFDRLGSQVQGGIMKWDHRALSGFFTPLKKRLTDDAIGIDPQRAELASPRVQTMGDQSAMGVKEMVIVNNMDAGLPLFQNIGNDTRTKAQFADAITNVTNTLLPYSAFRGWNWIANWWEYKPELRFASAEESIRYMAALEQAETSGKWDTILDTVDNRYYEWPQEAHSFFIKTLDDVLGASPDARKLVTASSGPVRRPHTYAPIYFRDLDEVDLHFQAEQITVPYWTAFAVDYYRRPGKPSFIHPEFKNDMGDGLQIFPLTWLALMRGVEGIGKSGNVPHWWRQPLDGRNAEYSQASTYRVLNGVLIAYGPWLRSLQAADQVAIMVCPRTSLIDKWAETMARSYSRYFAAYMTCLFARQTATVIYPEDVTVDELVKKYKAVLVVGQQVEMETKMAALLRGAQARGVKILTDASCRDSCVQGFTPLDIAFDKLEKIPAMNNDYAYWEYPEHLKSLVPGLQKALADVATPVAKVDMPEVMMSERRSGVLRLFYAVNVTRPPHDPAELLRVRPANSTSYPVVANITLPATGVVYDVLSRRLLPAGQPVMADLRFHAGRMYAVLPMPIAQLALNVTKRLSAGETISVTVRLLGKDGKAIDAHLPVVLRLLTEQGQLLEETPLAVPASGITTALQAPLTGNGTLTVEAIDMISGITIRQTVKVDGVINTDITDGSNAPFDWSRLPADSYFGAHLRDIVVSADEKTIMCNSFDWNANLHRLDALTGKQLDSQQIGQYYTISPASAGKGFAVQGYDLSSPALYQLYLLDGAGKAQRRFSLPGVPGRQAFWFVACILNDRANNFTVPASGKWVAACGNQALAIWAADGQMLWSRDWSKDERKTMQLQAVGENELLTVSGITAVLLNAQTGVEQWSIKLATSGNIDMTKVTPDGGTIAFLATTEYGPQIFLVRGGRVVCKISNAANELLLSPDGKRIILLDNNKLKCFSDEGDPLWTVTCTQPIYQARISSDGSRIAVSDDIGYLYVFDLNGAEVLRRDMGGYAITAWLKDGDLLAATWTGSVFRLAPNGAIRWQTLVNSAVTTTSVPPTTEFTPAILQTLTPTNRPNLLQNGNTIIIPEFGGKNFSRMSWQQPVELLLDGMTEPPTEPLIRWRDIVYIESGWKGEFILDIEHIHQNLRVDEIELIEDPAHPESWMRDTRLEYWDARADQWRFSAYLSANSSVHTHKLDPPVTSSRFRLLKADGYGWPTGNLRLAEIIFRGEALGCPHADAADDKPVAVLFDEGDSLFNETYLNNENKGLELRASNTGEAFSGGFFLYMNNSGSFQARSPRVKTTMPTWGFPIKENPVPGEYRYLRFAWRAFSEKTTGIALNFSEQGKNGVTVYTGKIHNLDLKQAIKAADAPPQKWEVVTIDLWELASRAPFSIGNMQLSCEGGAAAIDAVMLARSENDF